MSKNIPVLPSTSAGGDMVPHISAKRRHAIVDVVFEMTGGTERLADWADKNYGEFITSVWVKGLPKNISTEHTVGSGVEGLLDQLEAREKAAADVEAKTIDITPTRV